MDKEELKVLQTIAEELQTNALEQWTCFEAFSKVYLDAQDQCPVAVILGQTWQGALERMEDLIAMLERSQENASSSQAHECIVPAVHQH